MRPKVLLINPNRMKPPVTPVALDYLAQALEDRDIVVEVLDLAFSNDIEADVVTRLQNSTFTLIGVTVRNIDDSYFASQDFCLAKTRDLLNTIRLRTDRPIVLGGVGFSVMPASVLRYCGVDLGIQGEGEEALSRLVRRMAAGQSYDEVPGLVSRFDGLVRNTAPVPLPLDRMTLSRREAVDNLRYYREGGMVGFETKRGCAQACVYCADPLSKGKHIRMRDPEDVATELEGLVGRGIDHFHTCDSEFNLPEHHAIAVCQAIVRRGLSGRLRWYAYASPVPFSEELATWMRRAGCVGIDFGVDHGNGGMLKRLGRCHTPDDIRRTAALCHRHGFAFMFDLLLGGLGETRETVWDTMDLMKKTAPSRVGVSLGVRVYPGTVLGNHVQAMGIRPDTPGLHGTLVDNDDLLKPVYYLSPALGENAAAFVQDLIQGDRRFFFGGAEKVEGNYNYNDNSRLVSAIRDQGYRGAFWDILRRLDEE